MSDFLARRQEQLQREIQRGFQQELVACMGNFFTTQEQEDARAAIQQYLSQFDASAQIPRERYLVTTQQLDTAHQETYGKDFTPEEDEAERIWKIETIDTTTEHPRETFAHAQWRMRKVFVETTPEKQEEAIAQIAERIRYQAFRVFHQAYGHLGTIDDLDIRLVEAATAYMDALFADFRKAHERTAGD